jgi:hypothetical protein
MKALQGMRIGGRGRGAADGEIEAGIRDASRDEVAIHDFAGNA